MTKSKASQLFEYILHLIFPQKCIFCGTMFDVVPHIAICPECSKELKFVDQHKLQAHMRELKPSHFDDCLVACEYTGALKEAQIRYKFHDKPFYFRALGKLLADSLKGHSFDVIACVPLHKTRMAERGYNQSALIAKSVGKALCLPVDLNLLSRVKKTHSQSLLNKVARQANIQNAFEIINPKKTLGKSILLIDDILTTGLTLNECSRVLKASGAKSITIAAVATGATIDFKKQDIHGN